MLNAKTGLRAAIAALCAVSAGWAAAQGIPRDQWNANERNAMEMMRKGYEAQGMTFTEEQSELAVKSLRDQMARMMGAAAGAQMAAQMQGAMPRMPMAPMQAPMMSGAGQPAAAAGGAAGGTGAMSEADLAQTIAAWPPKPMPFAVSERKDGFDINGQAVLDPEGRIFSYAINAVSGAGSYALQGRNGVTIKAFSPAPPHQSQVIARAVQEQRGWTVTTTTGQSVFGETMSVLSDGFLVGRGASAFRYRTGHGLSNVAVPPGYFITPMQRGDVGSTGYVLLEKETEPQGSAGDNPMLSMVSALQAVGSAVGIGRKEDYALMDMRNGRLLPLNIPVEGKTIAIHSECRKVNWAMSKCKKAQSFESMFDTMGMKNNSHYFWKVRWMPTEKGPIAITQEDGVSSIYATNLGNGQKVRLFNRGLGIADWDVTHASDGRISVRARLVFEWQEIPDVLAFMQTAPTVEMEAKAEATTQPVDSGVASQ